MLLNAGKILNPGDVGMPYAVYALIGTLLWQAFSDAVSAPVQQLTSSAHMLSRVNFPAESLLLAALGRVLLNAAARFVVLVPVMVLARVSPGWGLVFVPVGVVGIVLAGYSVGLVLAPFGALYRDVGQALPLALSFLVLVTPVAYVPPKRGLIAHLVQLNPIAPPLQVTRGWLTGGAVAPTSSWWVVSVASVAVLAAGWSLFRLAIPHLVDRISQ